MTFSQTIRRSDSMAIADLKQVDHKAIKQAVKQAEAWMDASPSSVSAANLSSAAAQVEIAEATFQRSLVNLALEHARVILSMDKALRAMLPSFEQQIREPAHAAVMRPKVCVVRDKSRELYQWIVSQFNESPLGVRDLIPTMLESCQRLIDLANAMLEAADNAVSGPQAAPAVKRYALDAKAHMPRVPIPKPRPKPKPARKSKR